MSFIRLQNGISDKTKTLFALLLIAGLSHKYLFQPCVALWFSLTVRPTRRTTLKPLSLCTAVRQPSKVLLALAPAAGGNITICTAAKERPEPTIRHRQAKDTNEPACTLPNIAKVSKGMNTAHSRGRPSPSALTIVIFLRFEVPRYRDGRGRDMREACDHRDHGHRSTLGCQD